MLSVFARSSQNALRSLRPVAGVASAIAPTCKRTMSSNVPPAERMSFSQLEIPDARPVRSELWNTIGKKDQKSPEEIWTQRESTLVSQLDAPPNTWSGRSVSVTAQYPLHTAYARLARIMGRNRVPRELFLARRHEKKGVKRRRLASDRWRRKFAHEVRKKVQLVKEIRARGA